MHQSLRLGTPLGVAGLEGDLCINNTLALENTILLRTYAQYDERARLLGIAVKQWAKARGIADASKQYLSSYSFINLALFFLQRTSPPVLPNIQDPALVAMAEAAGFGVRKAVIDGHKVEFIDDLPFLLEWKKNEPVNEQPLGLLLPEFFRFYCEKFDFRRHVVSLRTGKILEKSKVDALAEPWRVSVQDPFEDRNLGKATAAAVLRRCHTKP